MPIRGHGGFCCGIAHIYNLAEFSAETLERETKNISLGYHHRRTVRCRLVEVVAAGNQINRWHNTLVDIGYVPVSEFINANSGRKIRIYHYFIPSTEWRETKMPEV